MALGHALKPCDLAHHANSAKIAVVEVLPKLLLLMARPRFKTLRLRVVHFQQVHGSEVADDVVDLLMQRQPVEQGEVDRETRILAPDREHFRVGREQNPRRRETNPDRSLLQALPGPGVNLRMVALEFRTHNARRISRQRQLRRRGQRRQAVDPIFPRRPKRVAIVDRVHRE